MSQLPYLNLGCGVTYDERWTNVDFVSTGPNVIAHNLLSGIPFPDASFDVVYHSHVLEHFPKDKALTFLQECRRVLRPGGIIRVAIPDLEQIVVNYKKYLDEALEGKPGAKEKYEWMLIELLDQMVRTNTGGEMLKYVADTSKNNDAFIVDRCGHEIIRLFEVVRGKSAPSRPAVPPKTPSLYRRAVNKLRRMIAEKALGGEYALLAPARFRSSGEVHQWMYDRFSLGELLKQAGFHSPQVRTAFESGVPGWMDFKLDGENGVVRKPDSLFMEAVK